MNQFAPKINNWNDLLHNFEKFNASLKDQNLTSKLQKYRAWYYCPQLELWAPATAICTLNQSELHRVHRSAYWRLEHYFDKVELYSKLFNQLHQDLLMFSHQNRFTLNTLIYQNKRVGGGIFYPKPEYCQSLL